MTRIEAPTNCPACNSPLTWKNDVLYCTSDTCEAKTQKSLQHWAKTMKIKGLGPQSLLKLEISTINELYELTQKDMELALGSTIGSKLYQELENSKLAPLDIVLPAFGISLIGNSATQKLKSSISHLDDLTPEKAKQAGLGPKATENLMKWFHTQYVPLFQDVLPLNFKFDKKVVQQLEKKGIVCITGKLTSFKTKAEAEKLLVEQGYVVKPSITKEVTILVNESGIESAKTQKAREAGVEIITNIKQLTGD